jgi:hypothetical protein
MVVRPSRSGRSAAPPPESGTQPPSAPTGRRRRGISVHAAAAPLGRMVRGGQCPGVPLRCTPGYSPSALRAPKGLWRVAGGKTRTGRRWHGRPSIAQRPVRGAAPGIRHPTTIRPNGAEATGDLCTCRRRPVGADGAGGAVSGGSASLHPRLLALGPSGPPSGPEGALASSRGQDADRPPMAWSSVHRAAAGPRRRPRNPAPNHHPPQRGGGDGGSLYMPPPPRWGGWCGGGSLRGFRFAAPPATRPRPFGPRRGFGYKPGARRGPAADGMVVRPSRSGRSAAPPPESGTQPPSAPTGRRRLGISVHAASAPLGRMVRGGSLRGFRFAAPPATRPRPFGPEIPVRRPRWEADAPRIAAVLHVPSPSIG